MSVLIKGNKYRLITEFEDLREFMDEDIYEQIEGLLEDHKEQIKEIEEEMEARQIEKMSLEEDVEFYRGLCFDAVRELEVIISRRLTKAQILNRLPNIRNNIYDNL
jgi:hypothetical protein